MKWTDVIGLAITCALLAFCVWQCDGCDKPRIDHLERRVDRLEDAKQ